MLRARSEAQRAQRRCEVWPVRYESGEGGLLEVEDAELVVLAVLPVLAALAVLERRRKGREGMR